MATFRENFSPSNGLVVKVLDSQSKGTLFKTSGWLQGGSALYPSEVDKISTRNFWEFSGKKVNCLLEVALALRQLNPIHKKEP